MYGLVAAVLDASTTDDDGATTWADNDDDDGVAAELKPQDNFVRQTSSSARSSVQRLYMVTILLYYCLRLHSSTSLSYRLAYYLL